jgi:hypothetical protein
MIRVRPIQNADGPWVARRLRDASVLPGFVATDGGRPLGLLTPTTWPATSARWWPQSHGAGPSRDRPGPDGRPPGTAPSPPGAAACGSSPPTTTPGPSASTSDGGWTFAPSTATARAARGRPSPRYRGWGPTGSRWTTSWSSSGGGPLREATQPRPTSDNPLGAKFRGRPLLQQASQPLTYYPISTVLEKASRIPKGVRLECSAQRFDPGFPLPSPRLAKKALDKSENAEGEEGGIPRRVSQEFGG